MIKHKKKKNSSLCVSHEGTQQQQNNNNQNEKTLHFRFPFRNFTHPISTPLFPRILLFDEISYLMKKGRQKERAR